MASILASALAGRGYASGGMVTGTPGHYSVTPAMVAAIKGAESGGEANPNAAVSSAGAQGGMQVMPGTAAEVAAGLGMANYDPTNEQQNTQVGTAYLNQLANMKGIDGDPNAIAAAYNAGPGRYLAGGTLPAETQAYVKKIMGTAVPGQPVAGLPSESDALNQAEAARHGGSGGTAPEARQVYDRPIGPTFTGAPMRSALLNSPVGSPSSAAPPIPGQSESDLLNRQEAAKHAGFGGFGSIAPRQVYTAPIGPTIGGAPMPSRMIGANNAGGHSGSGSGNEAMGGGGAGTMSPGGGMSQQGNAGGAQSSGIAGASGPNTTGADPRGDHTVTQVASNSGGVGGNGMGSITRPGFEEGGFVGSKVRGHQPEVRTIDFPDDAWRAIYGGRGDTPGAPDSPAMPGAARRTNFLAGGAIPGKPDGVVDNHKINADEGEFVVRRSAVNQAGPQLLQAINDPATAAKLRSLFNPQLIAALQKAGIIPQGGGGLATAIAGRR